MARKFNIGRQDEQHLNKELHDLFMSLKYINKGYGEPTKDKQTDIPVGSVWVNPDNTRNVLSIFTAQNSWQPMFKGYYHPANLQEKPAHPVHGQIWIDEDSNNKLFFYDLNTATWIPVAAEQANPNQIGYGGYDNFIDIYPMKASATAGAKKSFIIPRETFGKLFDGGTFIHTQDSAYAKVSEVAVDYTDKDTNQLESWIHVSPVRLNQCIKTLVKVNKDTNSHTPYEIFMTPYNTEFYGIDTTTKKGTLLKSDPTSTSGTSNDYMVTDVGIRLTPQAQKYDYVYAISYTFATSSRPGELVKHSATVGSDDEIYVGTYTHKPLVFLDGLYLEQEKYTYDSNTGMVHIVNDNIVAKMDMSSIIFDDVASDGTNYHEVTVNQGNVQNSTEVHVGPLSANAQAFKKPLAFVSGVMGGTPSVSITDEVEISGANAIIKNFGPVAANDTFKVLFVEADKMFVGSGTVGADKRIVHAGIDGQHKYLLFVDGVLVTERELEVAVGSIKTIGLVEGAQWLLLKTDDVNSFLAFDSIISDYTVKIQGNNAAAPYNNCDQAIVYVDGGVLVGEDAVNRYILPKRGVDGQVIIYNDNGTKAYRIWSAANNSWEAITDATETAKIEGLCTYFFSRGSISIKATANGFVGKDYTYYAYTFNNSVDEPLLYSHRAVNSATTDYDTNINHMFVPNVGALSMNLNNLYWPNFTEDPTTRGKFHLLPEEGISFVDADGVDHKSEFPNSPANPYDEGNLFYYVERPETNEQVSVRRIKLTAQDRNEAYLNAYSVPAGFRLLPGVVTVYVNGVRVNRSDFNILNENTIMFHFDLVGGQSHFDRKDPDTWKRYAYYEEAHEIKYFDCVKPDEIMVEVREDFKLQSQSIRPRYEGQNIFSAEDDGIPLSLLATKDYVKIYINGAAYNGDYMIDRDAGIIVLEDPIVYEVIGVDGMDRYLTLHPEEYLKYQENYGNYHRKMISDVITFEWR